MNVVRLTVPFRSENLPVICSSHLAGSGSGPISVPKSGEDRFVLASPRKVLIADDDALVRKAVARGLRNALGLKEEETLLADNIESACQVFQENQKAVRAVMTDICMPEDGAGLRLYDFIRERSSEIPIAMMSGGMNDASQKRLDQILQNDSRSRFVEKPISNIREVAAWFNSFWQ